MASDDTATANNMGDDNTVVLGLTSATVPQIHKEELVVMEVRSTPTDPGIKRDYNRWRSRERRVV